MLLEYMLIVRCWFSKLWMTTVQTWLEFCGLLDPKLTVIQDYGYEANWNALREDNRTLLKFNFRKMKVSVTVVNIRAGCESLLFGN